MRVLTGAEMKRLDRWAIDIYGMPSLLLMENAGAAAVKKSGQILNKLEGKQIIILAGKGNNGGDALVAARHLHDLGAEIRLFLVFAPEEMSGDVAVNWQLIEKKGLKWHMLRDENSFYILRLRLNQCDLVIDGIFGTGFKGSPDNNVVRVIQAVNESNVPVLAIDIPSGLDADTGRVENCAVKADHTITFAWLKRGLVLFPGKKYAGNVEVADISLPKEAVNELEQEVFYVTEDFVEGLVPLIDWQKHKHSAGHVLAIAGSGGMTGAAYFACKAAYRSGAGLISTCIPKSLLPSFCSLLPEAIAHGMDETSQLTLDISAWAQIENLLDRKKAILFGPGISRGENIRDILINLLEKARQPIIIDADGLYALAVDPDILQQSKSTIILTPHPGEMANLLGMPVEMIQYDRVKIALEAAEKFNAIVVLKGAATITATPAGAVYINSTGNPGLATAGTGDILTGVISGLIAQGMEPAAAAYFGVFLHGLAGDMVARKKGLHGTMASDVLEMLPYAIKEIADKDRSGKEK